MVIMIHQLLLLACDKPRRIKLPNIPQLKLGDIRGYHQSDISQFFKPYIHYDRFSFKI